jgi:drug/metabolite transporter (DMT)-like permease
MPDNPRQGAFYAIQAAIAFSLMGALIKAASVGMPNEMIVFTRCFIGLVILTPWALRMGLRQALKTHRWRGHLARAGFGIIAMYCFFFALGTLPLAKAMLLTYSMPLFIPFVAWIWLREAPTATVWLAVTLGFVGIALMVDPRDLGGGSLRGTLVGAASGLFGAVAMVSIRRISDTEPAPRIVMYFALIATLISAVPLGWAWVTPTPTQAGLMIAAGVVATLGQLCMTRAYGCAPAAWVGSFSYASVPVSAALAWLVWQETLSPRAMLGAALVISLCVGLSISAGRKSRLPEPP